MSAATGPTRRLAGFAASLRYSQLPAEVVATAQVAMLKIFAAALGGARTRIGQLHAQFACQTGGGVREATLIGSGIKVSRPLATYANGGLAFALDYEDVCHYVIHAGPIVVPAALAVGETAHCSGRQLLAAIVAGYEVGTRIGLSMQPSPQRGAQVWGQQYTPFAACVAAGNLLGLDARRMDAAMGVTGTYAPVPSAYKYFGVVAETRPMREAKLGWGWMAMAGVVGALSAKAGFSGGYGILDGNEGFWIMAGSDRCDFTRMTAGLGDEWLILGTDFKVHPSIAWSHPPYVALQGLLEEHAVAARQIARIRVWSVGTPRIADHRPSTAVDAQFSLPYALATTALRMPLTPALYDEKVIRSRRVRAMLDRVECLDDPQMDADWFQGNTMRARVEVHLQDGRVLSREASFPRDKPKFGRDEAIAKLRTLGEGLLTDSQLGRIVDAVDDLPRLRDVSTLARLLAPTGRKERRRAPRC
jgi:2-methylcitrate dehydratase PrpD